MVASEAMAEITGVKIAHAVSLSKQFTNIAWFWCRATDKGFLLETIVYSPYFNFLPDLINCAY